jgi:hypothetical protein
MALKACTECGREISTEARTCPHCGKKDPTRPRRGSGSLWGTIFVILIVLIAIGSLGRKQTSVEQGTSTTPPPAPLLTPKEEALGQVKLDFEWSKGGFDNIMMVDFVITNPTAHRLKDITITCFLIAPSGTVIDNNVRTIYENVPPKGSKKISKFNMGFINSQATRSSCRVTDVKVTDVAVR